MLVMVCGPLCGIAQKGDIESCTPAAAIVIDGDPAEWQVEWRTDSKGKFAYNICNDESNLYLRIRLSDEFTQRKVGLLGMTVYLNPKGKKMGKMGLKFPVAKDLEEFKRKAPKGQQSPAQLEELKMDLVRNEEVLELIGFDKNPIVSSRVGLMNGIEVTIKPGEHSTYVYEAKLPFKAFQIDKSKVKVLGVTIASGKVAIKNPGNTSPAGGGVGNLGYANRYGMGYGAYGAYGPNRSIPQWSEWNSATSMSVGVKLK